MTTTYRVPTAIQGLSDPVFMAIQIGRSLKTNIKSDAMAEVTFQMFAYLYSFMLVTDSIIGMIALIGLYITIHLEILSSLYPGNSYKRYRYLFTANTALSIVTLTSSLILKVHQQEYIMTWTQLLIVLDNDSAMDTPKLAYELLSGCIIYSLLCFTTIVLLGIFTESRFEMASLRRQLNFKNVELAALTFHCHLRPLWCLLSLNTVILILLNIWHLFGLIDLSPASMEIIIYFTASVNVAIGRRLYLFFLHDNRFCEISLQQFPT